MMKNFFIIKNEFICILFLGLYKITNEGERLMIKEIAWNTFKNTGSIKTYLELKKIENFQSTELLDKKVETNGNCKDEGNNNCRE